MSSKTKTTKQRNRFFAFCGHVNRDQPPVEKIRKLLSALDLDVKVWRYSNQPIFLVKREKRRLPPI